MKALLGLVLLAFVGGCATRPVTDEERRCEEGLDAVNAEFRAAQTTGLSENITLAKASVLINAAFAQKQFGKYTACLEKIERARTYIAEAQKR